MSKKQPIINKFFQPKTKDFVLSSKPLRIRQHNFTRTRNVKILDQSSVVISLLSSDEDDEITSDNHKTVDNNSSVNSVKIEAKFNNETANISTTSYDTSVNNKSDELMAVNDFLDVLVQEDSGPFDMKQSPKETAEDFQDYKLNNFSSMVDWVLNDKSNYHLFNEDDWIVIEHFKAMSGITSSSERLKINFPKLNFVYSFTVNSQRLYVRLYVRKHRWIRSSKISYPELGDNLEQRIDELVMKRLLLPCK